VRGGFDLENMICERFRRHFGLRSAPTFRQTPQVVQAVLAGITDIPAVCQRPSGVLVWIFVETLRTFTMQQNGGEFICFVFLIRPAEKMRLWSCWG